MAVLLVPQFPNLHARRLKVALLPWTSFIDCPHGVQVVFFCLFSFFFFVFFCQSPGGGCPLKVKDSGRQRNEM